MGRYNLYFQKEDAEKLEKQIEGFNIKYNMNLDMKKIKRMGENSLVSYAGILQSMERQGKLPLKD